MLPGAGAINGDAFLDQYIISFKQDFNGNQTIELHLPNNAHFVRTEANKNIEFVNCGNLTDKPGFYKATVYVKNLNPWQKQP